MKCSLLCDLILSRAGLRSVKKAVKNDHENVIQHFHKTLAVRTFQLFFARGPRKGKADADPSVSTLRPMKGLSW